MSMKYRESNLDKKLRSWFSNDYSRKLLRKIILKQGELRGLSKFSLTFEFPITAIAGRNGAGKSTALAIACCAFHNKRNGFKLKRRSIPYYTFSDFFIQHTEEIPPQGIEIEYHFAVNSFKKSEKRPNGEGIGYQVRRKRQGGKWNNYDLRIDSDVVFLGIDRIVPHSERSQSKSYSKSFKDTHPKGWEHEIAEIAGSIIGKKYDNLRYLEHSKYSLPIVSVGGLTYSGLNMGAGENALFEIFRVIYSCAEGALLVIDEVELGLHIDAQRKLVKALKAACFEKKIQIICTTHSKEVLDCLPPDARRYFECANGTTVITEGISPDFAMAKMGAVENKELDVLVEDGIASDILSFALPTPLRQRLRTTPIGSASALARQLSAAYVRKDVREFLAIFDGDQRELKSDNLAHARKMAEIKDEEFDQWFENHTAYLPGDTWPEAWLVQRNLESIESLAIILAADKAQLSEILEYGLQAGKHNEFHEISSHLGLEKHQCIQYFVINLAQNKPELFAETIDSVSAALNMED